MITRRAFITTGLVGTVAAQVAGPAPLARAVQERGVIDVHYHVNTETLRRLASRASGSDVLPAWQADRAIEQMDLARVELSVISTPVVPPVVAGGAEGHAAFARANNDDAARIVRDHPGRFAFFAYLPLPFVDQTLREIEYALDTLKAGGVYMCTSYGDLWLGDDRLAPVMAELNARRAIVYTHPMGASCCVEGLVPGSPPLVAGVPPTVVEYATDTTRTMASLIFSGAAKRYPGIQFIFSHAGGAAPFLLERFEEQARTTPDATPAGASPFIKKFFYDTAQAANPYALGTLLRLVPYTQILFGSDAPWREQAPQLAAIDAMQLGVEKTAAIRSGNARRILFGH